MQRLTKKTIIEQFPDIIKEMADKGVFAALKEKPEYADLLLGRGEKKQVLYDAVCAYRKGYRPGGSLPTASKVGKVRKAREPKSISVAQRDAIIRFLKSPPEHYRSRTATLRAAFDAIVPGIFKISSSTPARWYRYIGKPGYDPDVATPATSKPAPAAERNGHGRGIQILGQIYQVEDLEALVRERQNTLHMPKFCPECGHPLAMQAKAYSIALRHKKYEEG